MTSIFFALFIIIAAIYYAVREGRFKKFIFSLLIWQFIALCIIILYSYRAELNDIKFRVISAIMPSYGVNYKPGEILISKAIDGHFYIRVTINNVPIKFMVDTGASDVALTKEDAKRLNFDLTKLKYTKIYSTANGLSAAAPVILDNFVIGSKIFKNITASIGSGENDMSLLGMSILSRFKSFRIDQDKLILSY